MDQGWSGFAILCEVSHASRACQYIQQKYHKIPFDALPPSKDGVIVFVRRTEVLSFCSQTPAWIEEILLDLYSDSMVMRVFHRAFPIHVAHSNLQDLITPQTLDAVTNTLQAETDGAVRLQCSPRSVESIITENFKVTYRPKNFSHVINVIKYNDLYLCSLSRASSFWCKDVTIWAREGLGSITSAWNKIEEAMTRYKIPTGKKALDIGAAPGGWTSYFAAAGCQVIAMDPAQLDPNVKSLPNVIHLNYKLESETVPQLLKDFTSFDNIVCDACGHGPEGPIALIDMMVSVLDLLATGGSLVWTLKLMRRKENSQAQSTRLEALKASLQAKLGHRFERVEMVWLLANKNERTFIAINKLESPSTSS